MTDLSFSSNSFEAFLEAAPFHVQIVDKKGSILFQNKKMKSITNNFSIGKTCWSVYKDDGKQCGECPLHEAIETNQTKTLEVSNILGDRTFEIHHTGIIHGENDAVLEIFNDVTSRNVAEEALRNSKQYLAKIIDTISVPIFVLNQTHTLDLVNDAFCTISGISREDHLGKTNEELFPKEQYERFWQADEKVLQTGKESIGEEIIFSEQGASRRILIKRSLYVNTRGDRFVVGVINDITEKKEFEDQLHKLSQAIEQNPASIVITDVSGNIEYVNPKFTQLTGYTFEEVRGRNPRILKSGETSPEEYKNLWQTITSGKEWRGELHNKKKNGDMYWEFATISPIVNSDGKITNFLAEKEDITEKKKLESQLFRSQRLESIGTLAGGIAHDLNNILSPILLSIDILKKRHTSDIDKRTIDILESSTLRGRDIIKQILTFARGAEGKAGLLQPKHILREVENIVKETFPRIISIQCNSQKDTFPIIADVTQVHQVLMNLCVNARDAMPDGGTLTLEVENFSVDENYSKIRPDAKPGPYVALCVSDTGLGISPSIMEKIFEPFFTTKEIGKGTGLGLSTVQAIVKNHGGFINVYSEIGRGTRFIAYFPAAISGTEGEIIGLQSHLPLGSGQRILVIDDETSVLEITRQTLELHGYTVLTSSDGMEAVALYAEMKNEIDLVITDVMMPYLEGTALIQVFHKMNPALKIIASSGFKGNDPTPKLSPGEVFAFLLKPYTSSHLLETLHKAFSQPA